MHPIEIKMFKDDNNHACIEATGEWQGFAEFVSTDLQESLVNTEQVLSMLRHSDSAHDKLMGSFIGNAHELRITGDHVEIENQIDDEQDISVLPKEAVYQALSKWLSLISPAP